MTYVELLDALLFDVQLGLSGQTFKKRVAKGGVYKTVEGMSVYALELPLSEANRREALMPYATVRLAGGATSDDDDTWHVDVRIDFGIYDPNPDNSGAKALLLAIERLVDRYAWFPMIENSERRCCGRVDQGSIVWSVEDALHPFYFGGIQMTVATPKLNRKDVEDERIYLGEDKEDYIKRFLV